MTTGLVTDVLGYMTIEELLDTCVSLGIESLELGCGNWSKAPHMDLDGLLESTEKRRQFRNTLSSRGISIAALNCSGNQLEPTEEGDRHKSVVEKTFQLAELLEVETVVMMSGCPAGGPTDKTPNWITQAFLPLHEEILDYQWNEIAYPYWLQAVEKANTHGVKKIALENHGYNLVYNPETLFKLRKEVGKTIGMNLDPSHLFWMGGDPIAAARALGDAVYHVHAKDVRIERGVNDAQGLLDVKPIESFGERSWNYVALGYGHDIAWWKEFFTVLKMIGYGGPIVLEMEDMSMDPLTGVKKSMDVLKASMLRDFDKVEVLQYR